MRISSRRRRSRRGRRKRGQRNLYRRIVSKSAVPKVTGTMGCRIRRA